jgi:hypothetical protein
MKRIIGISGTIMLIFLTNSCTKENNTRPTITTAEVTNITSDSATLGGNLTYSDTYYTVFQKGVIWDTNTDLKYLYGHYTWDGPSTGIYTSKIGELKANTTYYVKAYVNYKHFGTNGLFPHDDEYTDYGDLVSFKTLSSGQK